MSAPVPDRNGKIFRLTVAQAVVRFLAAQYSERDGVEHKLFAGCWGIFGHGNVAGVGQALLQAELEEPGALPYYQARNEQAMVHAASAFARMRNRLSTLAWWRCCGPRPACPRASSTSFTGTRRLSTLYSTTRQPSKATASGGE